MDHVISSMKPKKVCVPFCDCGWHVDKNGIKKDKYRCTCVFHFIHVVMHNACVSYINILFCVAFLSMHLCIGEHDTTTASLVIIWTRLRHTAYLSRRNVTQPMFWQKTKVVNKIENAVVPHTKRRYGIYPRSIHSPITADQVEWWVASYHIGHASYPIPGLLSVQGKWDPKTRPVSHVNKHTIYW